MRLFHRATAALAQMLRRQLAQLGDTPPSNTAQGAGACRKGDAGRLVRKLLVMGVLLEDTFRQDNEYGNVASRMLVSPPEAAALRHAWAAHAAEGPSVPGCQKHVPAAPSRRLLGMQGIGHKEQQQTPSMRGWAFMHCMPGGHRTALLRQSVHLEPLQLHQDHRLLAQTLRLLQERLAGSAAGLPCQEGSRSGRRQAVQAQEGRRRSRRRWELGGA